MNRLEELLWITRKDLPLETTTYSPKRVETVHVYDQAAGRPSSFGTKLSLERRNCVGTLEIGWKIKMEHKIRKENNFP